VLQTTLQLNGPGVSRTSLLQDAALQQSRSGIACMSGAGTPASAVIALYTRDLNDPNATGVRLENPAVPISAALPGQSLPGLPCATGLASTGVDPSALATDDAVVYNNIAITYGVTVDLVNAPAAARRELQETGSAGATGPFAAFFGGGPALADRQAALRK
jgi:hypothetical protein